MRRTLTIIALASILGACNGLNDSRIDPAAPIQELAKAKSKPPVTLTKACPLPKNLPKRAISAGEVERFWSHDRSALVICGRRFRSLRDFYRYRDEGLSGSKISDRSPIEQTEE
jgi:hypothetical protein